MLTLIADVGRCLLYKTVGFVACGCSLRRYREVQEQLRQAAHWVGIICGPWRGDDEHLRRVDQIADQVVSGSYRWN